jgi:hypothetical protein
MLNETQSDPEAIRALSARLRAAAERVEDRMHGLDARVDDLTFHGPAALRLRAAMAERGIRGRRIAAELRAAAELAGHRADVR